MRISTAILITMTLGAGFTAWTQQTDSPKTAQRAMSYFYQAREGHFEVVPKTVLMLEEATAADPNNAQLWELLGTAYFFQLAAAGQGGQNQSEIVTGAKRAAGAFERALEIDPNYADALAGDGMAITILAGFERNPESFRKGMAEMNRAVELKPDSERVRLPRAFTQVNFPPQFRNNAAVIEDLSFLIQVADGSRAGDTLHILLGDVYAEGGHVDNARNEYQAAARALSKTREQAQERLAALDKGEVPQGDIIRLRTSLGTNCMMCHAK